ncbi:MAG: VUT family protein [Gammaproteobacteria bacterium]
MLKIVEKRSITTEEFYGINKEVINSAGYFYINILSMLYVAIMLCNAILTNRYIGNNHFYLLGGTLTSPFIFILDDIIAEVFGYKIARNIIFSGFAAQCCFVLICFLAVTSPFPDFFQNSESYYNILGPSLIRITLSGFIAYIIANIINLILPHTCRH